MEVETADRLQSPRNQCHCEGFARINPLFDKSSCGEDFSGLLEIAESIGLKVYRRFEGSSAATALATITF